MKEKTPVFERDPALANQHAFLLKMLQQRRRAVHHELVALGPKSLGGRHRAAPSSAGMPASVRLAELVPIMIASVNTYGAAPNR